MQDKLGCYRVGDLKFYSKLEAIEMHARTGTHPHWDFNEAVFSAYDWTHEPTETLDELYRQRAEQLRNKYDYLILMYSSGADSNSILRTFVDNDIQLDEIASYVNYSATGDRNDHMNNEIFNVALDRVGQLQQQCPWLRHRVIDLAQIELDFFNTAEARFDWIYGMNMLFMPNCTARENLAVKIKDWADLINQGKSLCVIWGIDKPRLHHENNRFSVRFLDIIDGGPTVKSMAGLNSYTDELFYWTPDLPKIVIKQAHVVMRYLKTHWQDSPWMGREKTGLPYITVNGQQHFLNNHGLHLLIYPTYYVGQSVWGKPASTVFSVRDIWFTEQEQDNRARQVWQMGVDKLFDLVPDYWKNDPKDPARGLKACWSKDYYLENV